MNRFATSFCLLIDCLCGALKDPRPRGKMARMALGILCGEFPKTITSALRWNGRTEDDWSADYRLFSKTAWTSSALFSTVLAEAV